MIRSICKEDILSCYQWYNYYIENSTAPFETKPLTYEAFESRVIEITKRYPWIVLEE